MYVCKDAGCQALWQVMIQRMNTKMNTTLYQIPRPRDTVGESRGAEILFLIFLFVNWSE